MLAVYVILTIVVSCVTVVATYFLLNAEGECAQVEVVVVATVLPPFSIYVYFMLQDYVSQVLSIHMLSFILFRLTHSLCSRPLPMCNFNLGPVQTTGGHGTPSHRAHPSRSTSSSTPCTTFCSGQSE